MRSYFYHCTFVIPAEQSLEFSAYQLTLKLQQIVIVHPCVWRTLLNAAITIEDCYPSNRSIQNESKKEISLEYGLRLS